MDIAVVGAGGSVGRAVTQMIVSERLLGCDQRLVLAGNPDGRSAKSLPGFAVDLMDAYAETAPRIEIALVAITITPTSQRWVNRILFSFGKVLMNARNLHSQVYQKRSFELVGCQDVNFGSR